MPASTILDLMMEQCEAFSNHVNSRPYLANLAKRREELYSLARSIADTVEQHQIETDNEELHRDLVVWLSGLNSLIAQFEKVYLAERTRELLPPD